MSKVLNHCEGIENRVDAAAIRLERIANGLSESLLSDRSVAAIFEDWDSRMTEGNFSKSMTDMMSEVSLFNSDSDLLLESDDSHYSVISFWLVERAAFYGLRPEFLQQLLQEAFKLSPDQMKDMYSLEIITKFLTANTKLIHSRRFMLLKELEGSSVDLSKMIRDRINEIDVILKGLVDSKDFKYYAQISATWLRSLELLAKLLGKFTNQTAQINIKTLNIQNFISINSTINDRLDKIDSKKVPKRYIDIIKRELTSEMEDLYDVEQKEEYALQRIG